MVGKQDEPENEYTEGASVTCPQGHEIKGMIIHRKDSPADALNYYVCCECAHSDRLCAYKVLRYGVQVTPLTLGELWAFYLSAKVHVARAKGLARLDMINTWTHDLGHIELHAKLLCFEEGLLKKDD